MQRHVLVNAIQKSSHSVPIPTCLPHASTLPFLAYDPLLVLHSDLTRPWPLTLGCFSFPTKKTIRYITSNSTHWEHSLYCLLRPALSVGETQLLSTFDLYLCTQLNQAQAFSSFSSWTYGIFLYGHRHKSEKGFGPTVVGDWKEVWATDACTLLMPSGPAWIQPQMYYFHTTMDACRTCRTL